MQQLDYETGRVVFYVVLAELLQPGGLKLSYFRAVDNQFCTGICEERTRAAGRRMATVGAVTRQ
jgi:hypothetical protein